MTDRAIAALPSATPGRLQGTATLVIQTQQAQRLLGGRVGGKTKHRAISLHHFSRLMRQLWLASRQNDPAALACLQRVDAALDDSQRALAELAQHMHKKLQTTNGIEIDVAQSAAPLRIGLRFGTPYGFKGAYLIADYDRLVCTVLTAQHTSVIKRITAEQLIRRGARLVRRVFVIPTGFNVAVTAQTDNAQKTNAEAQKAAVID